MTDESDDRYYVKARTVSPRFFHSDRSGPCYEGQILRRRFQHNSAVWSVVGRSRGHATAAEAVAAALRLAARRKLAVESDPRLVRMAEFSDRYGEDP